MDKVEDCDQIAKYFINKYQIAPECIEDNIRHPRAANQSFTITYKTTMTPSKWSFWLNHAQNHPFRDFDGEAASPLSQSVIQASTQSAKLDCR